MKRSHKHLLLAAALLVWQGLAAAQSAGTGWYVGATVGRANTDANISLVGGQGDKQDTGYKLMVGYQLSPNWAIEGQWQDLGAYRLRNATSTYELTQQGLSVSAVGLLPLGSAFSLFGKAGIAAQRFQDRFNTAGFSSTGSATKSVLLLGVGAEYQLSPAVSLRAEYEHFAQSTFDSGVRVRADLFSAGLRYRF